MIVDISVVNTLDIPITAQYSVAFDSHSIHKPEFVFSIPVRAHSSDEQCIDIKASYASLVAYIQAIGKI